ncbi:hypothetical protein [Teichococcus aestuarii]|uniref:Uncharacterized protein n=1 Tax=Teichococcus aestuarii TaxID=568898 RepID=A0A2U1V638_9PROT|nr:hypothetical protein [Pseudoroseomonas aestuarii]PWC29344.1 hypothetical protein CR165_09280 [Pseudoroseomonas aestuarii]
MRMKLGLVLAGLMLAGLPAGSALARGGVWIGIGPAYPAYPDPYPAYPYAPVPAPYPPPAYSYAPPAVEGRLGQACYAGPYMCQLDQPGYVGQACSCPARPGERAWGQVGD